MAVAHAGFEPGVPLDEVAGAWDALADSVGSPPWLRPGWFGAWAVAFGAGPARVAILRSDGAIVAVAPLARRGRVATSLTNYHTPAWGIVAVDEAARRAMADAIMRSSATRISIQFLSAAGRDREALEVAAARSGRHLLVRVLEHCPIVDTSVGWPAFEASLRGHFRRELRRRGRALGETGAVSFEVLGGTDDLERLLDAGFAVEAAGWKGERGTAIASRAGTEAFYRSIARWAAERGWLRLGFLRLDGRAIAFDFALEADGTHALLKTGFDPAFRRFAPGMLLRGAMLRNAFDTGVVRYHFLGHDDPWKREWTEVTDTQLLVQAFSRRPAGIVDWAAHRWGRPLAVRLRRR